MPRKPFRVLVTAFAAAGLLLSGCSSGSGPQQSSDTPADGSSISAASPVPTELNRYYRQRLKWRTCGPSGFQCATMRVPLDYADPPADPADDIKIAVSRKKAGSGADRIGSLVINPGGPGASAIGYLQSTAALTYPAPIRARYDMVAFDPRGVARSEPVRCLSDAEMDRHTRIDATPDNEREENGVVDAAKRFADGCAKRSSRVLPHVSTAETARDMDVLRALLGDKRLNYVGLSYGTFLGATYADLFPRRVGRLVLDGAMDPSVSSADAGRAQAGGFEKAFNAFAADCVKSVNCPLGTGSPRQAGAVLDRFFKKLDGSPVPTDDKGRSLNEPLATMGVMAALYDDSYWPTLRQAVRSAMKGDGSRLLQLSDLYYQRAANGRYSNLLYANAAVNCLDLPPAARTPEDVDRQLPSYRKASPRFGTTMAWANLTCAPWPVKARGKPHQVRARGAAPILVVGTTRDPATPYAWARSLASQLESGVLLTHDGDGHTAYTRGSDCVDTAVNTYLLEGDPPKKGKRCS